jgi:hypothetical protein
MREVIYRLSDRHVHHSDIVTAELKKDPPDMGVAGEHQPLAELYHDAMFAIRRLMEQNALLVEAMGKKLVVALEEFKETPVRWVPTHRHYKGTFYRVTGTRWNADHEELEEEVEYDDAAGKKYTLSRRRWDSFTGSGRPRYEHVNMVNDP